MQYERANKDLEAAVNRGLAAARFYGMAAGARVMRAEGVPVSVAARVLLQPPRFRRATDWRNGTTRI